MMFPLIPRTVGKLGWNLNPSCINYTNYPFYVQWFTRLWESYCCAFFVCLFPILFGELIHKISIANCPLNRFGQTELRRPRPQVFFSSHWPSSISSFSCVYCVLLLVSEWSYFPVPQLKMSKPPNCCLFHLPCGLIHSVTFPFLLPSSLDHHILSSDPGHRPVTCFHYLSSKK